MWSGVPTGTIKGMVTGADDGLWPKLKPPEQHTMDKYADEANIRAHLTIIEFLRGKPSSDRISMMPSGNSGLACAKSPKRSNIKKPLHIQIPRLC